MKTPTDPGIKILSLLVFLISWVALCAVFPDEITWFFEMLGVVFVVGTIAVLGLCAMLAALVNLFSPPPPDPPVSLPPPHLPPARPQLTPILVGLLLGWWLGGGPGNDGGDC